MVQSSAILNWLFNGETGISSKAMAATALGVHIEDAWDREPPQDPDDFNRCLKLVRAAPEVRESFDKIAALSPAWAAIVANWEKIESRFLDEAGIDWRKAREAPRTYYFMRELLDEASKKKQKRTA